MTCPSCKTENRAIARYCKRCGVQLVRQNDNSDPVSVQEDYDGFACLVDKNDVKNRLSEIVATAKSLSERCKKQNILNQRMELSFVITGEPGTGKTTVANVIAEELFRAGIVSTNMPYVVDPIKYQEFIKDLDASVKKVGNAVLIVEEAEKLVPEGLAVDVSQIDYVLKSVKEWRGAPDKPVVIFTGKPRLKDFFDNNPNSASFVNYFLETGELSVDGLVSVTDKIMHKEYKLALSDEALEKLHRIYVYDKKNPDEAKGVNGHNAAKRAYQIQLRCAERNYTESLVQPDLIDGKEFIPMTFDQVMEKFDKYVGVEDIKKEILRIANSLDEVRRLKGDDAVIEIKDHFQFLGNPGTGKTTMARLFAEAMSALGALPLGHLVEVSRNDLISQYVGDTPKAVTKCFDKAMGGVLFIDEAYSLKSNPNDSVGQEAVDTLIQLAENRRGKLVVIIAGYNKEMGEFMQSNSGLESRFNRVINFRDYTGPELAEIFRKMVATSEEGYELSKDAADNLDQFFNKVYATRIRTFGNAREVRNIYSKAVGALTDRNEQKRKDGSLDPAQARVITLQDIEGEANSGKASVEEILNSLDDLVGMESVKKQLRSIANKVKLDRMRMLKGGKAVQPNLHIVITGNPGTGKTVVAKRLGAIFKAMGVLPKGHVVERERKTLLDSYANSAGQNMEKAVDEAIGGILFIDEAYNLIPMSTPGHKDKDGVAAVEALMTRMSNDAGKFVTVIAGYKAEIEEFVANANPGLARRFTHRIHIDDYSVDNLVDIFKLNAQKEGFIFTEDAEKLLYKKVEEMVTMKDKNFGNAGEMIKLFNATKDRQANRLSENLDDDLSEEALYTFQAADIPYDPPKKIDVSECLRELDNLVGLASVKDAVRELADTIIVEQKRAAEAGKRPEYNLDHYLFLGNPGTGKTTVARIMGNIFYSLGLLPSNKVVEVTTKDLIAPYVGQTAPKTEQMIDRALGGIFFIDEAYGLNDGANGFGKDAMPVLLTKLIDYKGKMVCVAAGYPMEMQDWIDTNSGLESRFTRKIYFEDYSSEELAEIFANIVKKNDMQMDENATSEMKRYFDILVYNKGDNFANAREAGNYFNRVKLNQGRRLRKLMELPGFDRNEMYILRASDMIIG